MGLADMALNGQLGRRILGRQHLVRQSAIDQGEDRKEGRAGERPDGVRADAARQRLALACRIRNNAG